MGPVGLVHATITAQISVDFLKTTDFAMRPWLWLKLMSQNRGTLSFSPMFGYELCARWLEHKESHDYDLSAWRVAGVGAGMIRKEPLEKFASLLAPSGFNPDTFTAGYGMAECSLAELGRDTLELVRPRAAARAVGLHLTGFDDDADLRLLADGVQLKQVLLNLLRNAQQAAPADAPIGVRCGQAEEDWVEVAIQNGGDPIPPNVLDRIFEPFYTAGNKYTRGVGSSGLGLAISKQIVEAHGGVIWAENIRPTDADITSEPLGARFVVELPVVPE